MRFLKGLWKFLVGVKDALALLALLLFFGAIFAALSSGDIALDPAEDFAGFLEKSFPGVCLFSALSLESLLLVFTLWTVRIIFFPKSL